MKTDLIIIPNEVQQLAEMVNVEKRHEVMNVLNQIFTGTADWKRQVQEIKVKDVNDVMSIQLATVAAKQAKDARLAGEKIIDAKRDDVQKLKAEFDVEDKLWLKAKQTMQILFKEVEDIARWEANYVERFEKDQKVIRTENRRLRVSQFADIAVFEFENMTPEMFDVFAGGLEKSHNDTIEAGRILEEERIAKAKAEAEAKAKMEAENKRLKEEAEAKEKALAIERAKAEAERKALELKAQKEKAASDAKLKAEREANEKLQAEIRAKAEAERKAKNDAEIKVAAELKAKQQAEAKAAKAPKKQKLTTWIDGIVMTAPVGMAEDETVIEILEKFEAFKKWAKTKIETA